MRQQGARHAVERLVAVHRVVAAPAVDVHVDEARREEWPRRLGWIRRPPRRSGRRPRRAARRRPPTRGSADRRRSPRRVRAPSWRSHPADRTAFAPRGDADRRSWARASAAAASCSVGASSGAGSWRRPPAAARGGGPPRGSRRTTPARGGAAGAARRPFGPGDLPRPPRTIGGSSPSRRRRSRRPSPRSTCRLPAVPYSSSERPVRTKGDARRLDGQVGTLGESPPPPTTSRPRPPARALVAGALLDDRPGRGRDEGRRPEEEADGVEKVDAQVEHRATPAVARLRRQEMGRDGIESSCRGRCRVGRGAGRRSRRHVPAPEPRPWPARSA